jgi:hypothetical protein
MRQHHVAGERMFVDYAGTTLTVIDPSIGEARTALSSGHGLELGHRGIGPGQEIVDPAIGMTVGNFSDDV